MAFDWDPNKPAPTTFGLAESGPRRLGDAFTDPASSTGSPATPEVIVPGEALLGIAAPTLFGAVYNAERALGTKPADALDRAEEALRREAAVLRSL